MTPSDQADRARVVRERARNVVIDAGAGTGKTTTLVRRVVNLIAPDDGTAPLQLSRIAAITFTRRAAGELQLRIREQLLNQLASAGDSSGRAELLRAGLGDLDSAHVGTIHSFADRLLRRFPMETALSPEYEIVEDESALVAEVTAILLEAGQAGDLTRHLEGTEAAAFAKEAEATLSDAIRAGIPTQSWETEWRYHAGIDALAAAFARQRDVAFDLPAACAFDADLFRAAAREMIGAGRAVSAASRGGRHVRRVVTALEAALPLEDPAAIYARIQRVVSHKMSGITKGRDFSHDDTAWSAWMVFHKGRGRAGEEPLRDAILDPFRAWLAPRLVRLRPVVLALYDQVKARHRAVDQLDLLIRLRDLLRDDPRARAESQALFDHILVDEFQDTDPLQAEILMFLCERGTSAKAMAEVELDSGKLTVVGDPKQSIYRFRRADIETYDRVVRLVQSSPHVSGRLSANYRSRPELLEWFNDRLAKLLGRAGPEQSAFDPARGKVFYQDLLSPEAGNEGAADTRETPACVHVLPFDVREDSDEKADDYRRAESEALARYLKWLVDESDVTVRDPDTGDRRSPRYGDIAVLAVTTTHLGLLFDQLDRVGVPYSSRGGTLFLQDALHQQLILGLRAIADRDDGVAQAALFRPPFFAIDPLDVLSARAAAAGSDGVDADRAARGQAALDLVTELRQQRFNRPVGTTARDLLERTAFARTVALGPNGAQRLTRLRELCLALERIAAEDQLDYDAATARIRAWIDAPESLDPPRPVASQAIEVITVHQAKGLEYPITVLWDGKALLGGRDGGGAFRVDRSGRGWTLDLSGCEYEHPPSLGLAKTETEYRAAERLRVVYVAATRARDLLVLPLAGKVDKGTIAGALIGADAQPHPHALVLPRFVEGKGAKWSKKLRLAQAWPELSVTSADAEIAAQWAEALHRSSAPRFVPVAVSSEAAAVIQARPADDLDDAPASRKRREGRFGPLFGETVHRAIGKVILERAADASDAVARAAAETGLEADLHAAATEDVTRALEALRREGLLGSPSAVVRLEYPVAAPAEGGKLLLGYVDFVVAKGDELVVVDFKTDAAPKGDVIVTHAEYVEQVRTYSHMLGAKRGRAGLLFSEDGRMRWV